MAQKRQINTKFWDDSYIVNLDPIEKLLFLYLLTNPLTNISGIYEIQIRRIAFDTGIDKDMVLKVLERFERDGKVHFKDGWIIITNFIKNQTLNPSVISGVQRELNSLPKELIDRLGTDWGESVLLNLTKLNLTLPNLTKPNAEADTHNQLKKFRDNFGEMK